MRTRVAALGHIYRCMSIHEHACLHALLYKKHRRAWKQECVGGFVISVVCVCVCVCRYTLSVRCVTHTHTHTHTDTHTHTHTSGNADLSSIQRDYELTKYVLEGHETLAGLALKFNCRMEELKRINGIASLTSGIFFVVCV